VTFGFLGALADDDDIDFLADRGVGDDARQILRLLDVLAVEGDDDVAGLDAGGLRRALVVDAGDQGAARRLDVEAFGDLVGDLLDADAEPAAAKLAELAQLIDHAGHGLGGHRKADADRAAGRRDDQGVDADHFAVEVEQRAAGIAAVDGGVGLDVVVIGTRLMSRLRAETMPAVTVPPRLNGLPIAITHSPSRSLSESPNFTAISGLSA
jgi:hypothetical protein